MTSMPSPAWMITRLPDELPELGIGRHRRPRDGACLMEYVSVLAGTRFTHFPECTHPALCVVAHRVNDATSEAGRPHLARLAPDLVTVHDDGRVSNIGATVVLGLATAALSWAPQDRFLRRLHRRAVENHDADGRSWRYAVELSFFTLMRHMRDLDDEARDRCLYAVLERVIDDCRTGYVLSSRPSLIDRIDRRPRALR